MRYEWGKYEWVRRFLKVLVRPVQDPFPGHAEYRSNIRISELALLPGLRVLKLARGTEDLGSVHT